MASKTRVVNRRRDREEVYIGRGSDFGNPYHIGEHGDRASVIRQYRSYFEERLFNEPGFGAKVEALRGKVLGCYCKPQACHGDVIVEYLERTAQ